MSKINFSREATESELYDLVVCGGGPAGTAAAIAAGRRGLKAVIIEQFGQLGGVAVNSLVAGWLGSYCRDIRSSKESGNFLGGAPGETGVPVVGGIFDEVVERMATEDEAIPAHKDASSGTRHLGYASWHGRVAAFEYESCKRVLEQTALEAGVEIRYFTSIIGCKVKGEVIEGVFVHSKSGIEFIRGKAFVDATGDADVADAAGCPMEKGREEDGLMQMATMISVIEDVDSRAFEKYCRKTGDTRLKEALARYNKSHKEPFPFDIIICCEMPRRGRFFLNTFHLVGVDGTDSKSMTKGMVDGRSMVHKLIGAVKEIVPGFENCRLVQTSPVVGIRDTRRIKGQYKLMVDDLVYGKRFDDVVALSGFGWDMTDPKEPGKQAMKETPMPLPYVEIPYRIMVPQKIGNLIAAGRCVSVEWQALGPIRIMPACFAMGEAAGTAAAQVVGKSISFAKVDVGKLQQDLREQGAILEV